MATSSLDDSIQTTSKARDVSLARQRRRRTTKRSGRNSLNHADLRNGDDTSSMPLTQASDTLGASLQPTMTNNDSDSISSTGTARQRRTRKKRESVRRRVVATVDQADITPRQPDLEDSTAGVASLLERNLDQTNGSGTPGLGRNPDGEVIFNPGAELLNHPSVEAEYTSQQNEGEEQASQHNEGETEQGDPVINGNAPIWCCVFI